MLVVDRREDESAFELGANRSEAQRDPQDPEHIAIHNKTSLVEDHGIICLKATPGPDFLLKLLLNKVWGCSLLDN